MNRFYVAAVVCLSSSLVWAAKPSMAVLNIKTSGVEKRFGPLLTEVLSAEVAAVNRYEVIAGSDVESMLGFEAEKQLLGCTESECLAEIAGALGADMILVADVGKIGETFLVNLKVLDINRAKTVARVSKTLQGAEDVLIPGIKEAAKELLVQAIAALPQEAAPVDVSSDKPQEAETASSSAEVKTSATPRKTKLHPGPLVVMGVGVASLAVYAALGVLAQQDAEFAQSGDVGSQLSVADGQAKQLGANIAFGVGVAALAGGAIWLIVDLVGQKNQTRSVQASVVPSEGGATAWIGGQF